MTVAWTPSPFIIAHPTLFTAEEIALFEKEVLTNENANEHTASGFFKRHPKFLLMGNGAEIRAEVALQTADGLRTQRVDFFRRSFGETFWDIVELKTPQANTIVLPKGQYPRESVFVTKAIRQAQDYRERILTNETLRNQLLRSGIAVSRPQITIIAGQIQSDIPPQTLAALYDRIRTPIVSVKSYSDIYKFACEHFRGNSLFVSSAVIVNALNITPAGPPEFNLLLAERDNEFILSIGESALVDSTAIDALSIELNHLSQVDPNRPLTLDFTGVEFMSSLAIARLMSAQRKIASDRHGFTLTGMRPELREMFKILRIDRLFNFRERL
jgi:anti-anti-sigma regulatory factor